MFYHPSASRLVLDGWVRGLLRELAPESADARTLDEITTVEVIDLAYLEGSELDTSVAGHALFPTYVEQAERMRSAPSAMVVSLPVRIEGPTCSFTISLRWGRASELVIGEAGTARRRAPNVPVPEELLSPLIGGTSFSLREEGGQRLRSLAGPFRSYEQSFTYTISGNPQGEEIETIISHGEDRVYAYVDDHGVVQRDLRNGNLHPLPLNRAHLPGYYLWEHALPATVELRCKWRRVGAQAITFSCSLRNLTIPNPQGVASDALLGALLLPHVRIMFTGAFPEFPRQQYAEAKAQMTTLSEDQRLEEASRRLYAVRQSGCIATRSTTQPQCILLTTFGIFDTPRERPLQGPRLTDVLAGPDNFLAQCPVSSDRLRAFVHERWARLRSICVAAQNAFGLEHFHQFQWDAITQNLLLLAERNSRPVTIVRAPTSAGKTLVFMINAAVASLCADERGSAVLLFPTRILNEDMFRRLTAFVFRIREQLQGLNVRGGLLMGTQDPLYRLLLNPAVGEPMHHYGACPACGSQPLVASETAGSIWPTCSTCGHIVDYMDNPREVSTALPDIIIATPDKIFYEATAQGFEWYLYGLFGAPVRRCQSCNKAVATVFLSLKPKRTCKEVFKSRGCDGLLGDEVISKPIRYMGFDEIHSLYGEVATYVSIFLATLESMQSLLTERRDIGIRFETATATIANETELLEAITRRRATSGEIVAIPPDANMAEYFVIEQNTVRHRVLLTLPTRISSREAFIRTVLNSYRHLRTEQGDVIARLRQLCGYPEDWGFLLGYVFKKQEGLDLRRSLGDFYRNRFGETLRIEFLSGDAPKNQISRILHEALNQELDLLLANLVISLGMDIHGLNHMVMLGVPRSFTEYVQTAGRTGRGRAPGHVSVILQPHYPRDVYLYRHFHAVLSDVSGYYDVLPVRSTNLYCAEQVFGNVAKAILSAICMRPSRPQWPNRPGLQSALNGRLGAVEAGISGILCDDPALADATRQLASTRLRTLLDQVSSRNEFLSNVVKAPDARWLIYSLRGRSGNVVPVICTDQLLVQRVGSPGGDEESEEDALE